MTITKKGYQSESCHPCLQAEEDGPSSPKKPRFVQDALEECDETEEDAMFFVLDEDGNIIKRVGHLMSDTANLVVHRVMLCNSVIIMLAMAYLYVSFVP